VVTCIANSLRNSCFCRLLLGSRGERFCESPVKKVKRRAPRGAKEWGPVTGPTVRQKAFSPIAPSKFELNAYLETARWPCHGGNSAEIIRVAEIIVRKTKIGIVKDVVCFSPQSDPAALIAQPEVLG
jgi:hypothetical protein